MLFKKIHAPILGVPQELVDSEVVQVESVEEDGKRYGFTLKEWDETQQCFIGKAIVDDEWVEGETKKFVPVKKEISDGVFEEVAYTETPEEATEAEELLKTRYFYIERRNTVDGSLNGFSATKCENAKNVYDAFYDEGDDAQGLYEPWIAEITEEEYNKFPYIYPEKWIYGGEYDEDEENETFEEKLNAFVDRLNDGGERLNACLYDGGEYSTEREIQVRFKENHEENYAALLKLCAENNAIIVSTNPATYATVVRFEK